MQLYTANDYQYHKGHTTKQRATLPNDFKHIGYTEDYKIGRRIREEIERDKQLKGKKSKNDAFTVDSYGNVRIASPSREIYDLLDDELSRNESEYRKTIRNRKPHKSDNIEYISDDYLLMKHRNMLRKPLNPKVRKKCGFYSAL